MDTHELLEYFINHYYPRQEIAYRLPMSVPISDFWPEELRFRLSQSVTSYSRMKNGQRAIRKRTTAARGADMILF